MSADLSGSLPPVGHTDDKGNWHWGSPADRAERIATDNAPPPPEPTTPREELVEAALTIEDTTQEQDRGME